MFDLLKILDRLNPLKTLECFFKYLMFQNNIFFGLEKCFYSFSTIPSTFLLGLYAICILHLSKALLLIENTDYYCTLVSTQVRMHVWSARRVCIQGCHIAIIVCRQRVREWVREWVSDNSNYGFWRTSFSNW